MPQKQMVLWPRIKRQVEDGQSETRPFPSSVIDRRFEIRKVHVENKHQDILRVRLSLEIAQQITPVGTFITCDIHCRLDAALLIYASTKQAIVFIEFRIVGRQAGAARDTGREKAEIEMSGLRTQATADPIEQQLGRSLELRYGPMKKLHWVVKFLIGFAVVDTL